MVRNICRYTRVIAKSGKGYVKDTFTFEPKEASRTDTITQKTYEVRANSSREIPTGSLSSKRVKNFLCFVLAYVRKEVYIGTASYYTRTGGGINECYEVVQQGYF